MYAWTGSVTLGLEAQSDISQRDLLAEICIERFHGAQSDL